MCRLSKPQANKQGFTLIEVLIVVVIMGVLAALVIPRMIASPEKAKMAEAYQMIGAVIRAQQARMDTTGITVPVNFNCPVAPSTCTPPSSLGMGNIIQKDFIYACDGDTGEYVCRATRLKAGNPTINRWYIGPSAGTWECINGYVTADGGVEGASTQGCKPNW